VQHLGLPRAERAHRALADAEMAAALLARMQHDLTNQWQLPSADFAQLQAVQRCTRKTLAQWLARQAHNDAQAVSAAKARARATAATPQMSLLFD
jgi:DNA polymerase-3 subunit epsilon